MKAILSRSNRDKLLQAFRRHLVSAQGLAPRTCAGRVFYSREFLNRQLKRVRGRLRLRELTPQVLLRYVLERSGVDSPVRLQALATALRSFCRFLHWSGRTHRDLAVALPRIASPGRSLLPDYLEPGQLKALLASIDTSLPLGKRNVAILLCLARLGLRAGEVAALTLDQIQWRTGVVRLGGGKSRRERQLPLPDDVGRAIADYLRAQPRQAGTRRIFCALRGRRRPLSSPAISLIAVRALQRAGMHRNGTGAHLLRRTLASHLVQEGVSLKSIADLLGHRCLDTTRIYAGVNHSMLLKVARPWPVEGSR